jgi:hypothetical protein
MRVDFSPLCVLSYCSTAESVKGFLDCCAATGWVRLGRAILEAALALRRTERFNEAVSIISHNIVTNIDDVDYRLCPERVLIMVPKSRACPRMDISPAL